MARAPLSPSGQKGGLLPELLLCRSITLFVSRTRSQAGVVQPFQQIVHAVQAVFDSKLPIKNAHYVLAAHGAHAVFGSRAGVESRLEFCFPFLRQLRFAAWSRLGLNRVDSAVAVSVHPVLHAATRAI